MNKIDLIIDALSIAQNSVWSKLNEEALAYAVELKLELAKPEQIITPISPDQYERFCGKCGACLGKPWVNLTEDEIKEVLGLNEAPWSLTGVAWQHVMDDVRALEAKLKEKNND